EETQAERELALAHQTVETPAPEPWFDAVDGTRPEERDAGGEDEPEHKPRHRDPPLTRNPRASLTAYCRDASVVRDGSVPLASIRPRAENAIRQTMMAATWYPLEPQLAST